MNNRFAVSLLFVVCRGVHGHRLVGDPRRAMPADTGRLHVDVHPPDASIYIDGVFRGAARAMDGVLLPSGRHHAEIVRPGYRTAEREIEVRSGETTDLRAELER